MERNTPHDPRTAIDRRRNGQPAVMAWVAPVLTAETGLLVLAGVAWFLTRGYTLAEAGAGAVVVVFMIFSLIHQICFFVGSPPAGLLMEGVTLAAVLFVGRQRWLPVLRMLPSATHVVHQAVFPGVAIAATWAVMAAGVGVEWLAELPVPAVSLLNPPADGWPFVGSALSANAHAIPPLNAPALSFHTARFGLNPGACGFGLLAHMAIGFSTYALARRYAWPPMALTVTLMVLGMPRLVFLACWPSAELISTTAIVFCLVLVYRLVEQHQAGDLRLFLLVLLFSINVNPMSIALVPIMLLLCAVIMIRRHGWLMWRELIVDKPLLSAITVLPALALAQIPVFALNLAHDRPLFGTATALEHDGIRGTVVNLIRYLLISVDPTEPVQRFLAWLVELDLKRMLVGIYTVVATLVASHAGTNGTFDPIFSGGNGVGFGPIALLLVVPAMTHALLRGPRRLKALSVAWMGYLYLAAVVVAWQPDNLRILTPLYAANGFVVAFALPPWRLRRRGMRLLQAAFALLMAWSLAIGA